MARRIWVVLLGLGAIAGFAGGFMQLHHMRHHGYGYGPGWEGGSGWGHHELGRGSGEFEDHVADVCARAAERVMRDRPDHHDSPRPEPQRPEPPPPGP